MEPTGNLNVTHPDCLRSITNIGETVVQNICNGTQTTVPWGTVEWLAFIVIGALVMAMAVTAIGLAIAIIRDR